MIAFEIFLKFLQTWKILFFALRPKGTKVEWDYKLHSIFSLLSQQFALLTILLVVSHKAILASDQICDILSHECTG